MLSAPLAPTRPRGPATGAGLALLAGAALLGAAVAGEPGPAAAPPLEGAELLAFGLAAALATLVSEDLACAVTGALVADGRLPLAAGVLACALGIFAGDLAIFLAARRAGSGPRGRRLLARAGAERVERVRGWFARYGPAVILFSRFVPGTRVATCVAAGLLGMSPGRFAAWFALAAALWTPAAVGLAGGAGRALAAGTDLAGFELAAALGGALAAVLLLGRLLLPLATWRGRRLLGARWRRIARWEYWPAWLFYAPIALYGLGLASRHRSATAFTAANPGIPLGGFAGESKGAILRALAAGGAPVPRTELLPAELPLRARLAAARRLQRSLVRPWPLVVKPDVGERGRGVSVIRTGRELRAALAAPTDLLLQEHVTGREYGLFYARRPGEPRGRLLSIAEKRLPSVRGDGRSTLERLILADPRAVCYARSFFTRLAGRLDEVVPDGEEVRLSEVGSHCRGAAFLDARELSTPALEAAVERAARALSGFHLGRFDVVAPSAEALREGSFRILELNGVTAEMAHVYDPGLSLANAWRTLAAQWRLAFELGAGHARAGARVAGPVELARAALQARRGRGSA